MKINFVKAILLMTAMAMSHHVSAGVIKIADWHDANGNDTNGLRQSAFDSSVYFAVAKDIDIEQSEIYEVADGWHIASFSEYVSRYNAAISPLKSVVHFNTLGWQFYTSKSGASDHVFFAFSDSFDDSKINRSCFSGKNESDCTKASDTSKWGNYLTGDYKSYFAGLVVIKEGNKEWPSVNIPEPSTFVIFALGMMGLAMRRFNN